MNDRYSWDEDREGRSNRETWRGRNQREGSGRDYSGEFGSRYGSERYSDHDDRDATRSYRMDAYGTRSWDPDRTGRRGEARPSRSYDRDSEFQTSDRRYEGTGVASYGSTHGYGPSSQSGDYFGAGDYGSGAHAWDRGSTQSYAGSGRYSNTYNPAGLTAGSAMPYAPGSHDRGDARQSWQRSYGQDQERGFLDRASDEVMSWFGDEEAARRREMDHRGHGPSDYTRSDDRICEDVNDRLTDDWRVDARHISVSVEGGEVTLNGKVPNRDAKRRAEDCVESISGVRHVQNNLRVDDTLAGSGTTGSSYGNWGRGAGGEGSAFGTSTSGTTTSGTTTGAGVTSGSGTAGASTTGKTTGSTSA